MQQDISLTYNQAKFVDLSLLNETGKHKLLEFYRELLNIFPQKSNKKKEITPKPDVINWQYRLELFRNMVERNKQHNLNVSTGIDISELANEVFEGNNN